MKDKNNREIVPGVLLKRAGLVQYADGLRYKVSKKTWKVSKVEDDKVFYQEKMTDWKGEEVVDELELKLPKNEGEFLVVGDEDGFFPEFAPVEGVSVGSVADKYRVLKDVIEQNWKAGDVVSIVGKVSHEMLTNGVLQLVDKDTPHKHVLIVVEPILLNNTVKYG